MTDFHPPAIAANLIALSSSSASASVLRIHRDSFARELSKSQHISCTYCREWATNVYKHFYLPSSSTSSKALPNSDEKAIPRSSTWKEKISCKDLLPRIWESVANFTETRKADQAYNAFVAGNRTATCTLLDEVYNEVNATTDSEKPGAVPQTAEYMDVVLDAVKSWTSQPPKGKPLPDFVGPVAVSEDNVPFPDAATGAPYPLDLLNSVNWDDRTYLCLPASAYHLLRTVTKVALNAQFNGNCHPRPKWRTPTEEKMGREALSGEIQRQGRDAQKEVESHLEDLWSPLRVVLNRIKAQNKVRELVLGPKAAETMMQNLEDRYASALAGFSMYEKYKKEGKGKKGPKLDFPVEELDNEFTQYMEGVDNVSGVLLKEFLAPLANDAIAIVEDTVAHLGNVMEETRQRFSSGSSTLPDRAKLRLDIICDSVKTSFDQLIILTESQKSELEHDLLCRRTDLAEELKTILSMYLDESQPTVVGRMEKIANPAFRKRIRRFESNHAALRQWFHSSCSKRLLPAKALAVAALPLIDTLMRDGEKREVSLLQELLSPKAELCGILHLAEIKREGAVREFSNGINTGRIELSVFVAHQFLQEADRLFQESRAIKRQSTLLKQINPESAAPGSSSAAGKKKRKDEKQANSPDVLSVMPSTPESINEVPASKTKKKTKKKKGALLQTTDETDSQGRIDADATTVAKPTLLDQVEYAMKNASVREDQQSTSLLESKEEGKNRRPLRISAERSKDVSPATQIVPSLTEKTTPISESDHAEGRSPNGAAADICHIDSLSPNLESVPPSQLISIIRSLHEDKNNLIMALMDMSKQVSSLSTRYAELLGLVRKMEEERNEDGPKEPRHIGHHDQDWESNAPSPFPSTDSAATRSSPHQTMCDPPPGFLPASSEYPFVASETAATVISPARQPRIPSAQGKGFRGARRAGGTAHEQQQRQGRCDNCFERGHASANCANGCLNCGSKGHFRADCRV